MALLAIGLNLPSYSTEKVEGEVVGEISATSTVQLPPTLKRICSCESTGSPNNEPQHYDNEGNVLLGKVNPKDTGMCQINQDYWLEESRSLGYDIFTPTGNKEMAIYIYETAGTSPWSWSKGCHNS